MSGFNEGGSVLPVALYSFIASMSTCREETVIVSIKCVILKPVVAV